MAQLTYKIDPVHSSAQFSVRHMMITNVRGEFTKLSGTIVWDPENPGASTIEASIDAASISTREEQRDAHLKSADFLDVEKFPTLAFHSEGITGADGELDVVGNLTIHGVTREVALEVEGPTPEIKDPYGNVRIGATAGTKLYRKDFGLSWNSLLEAGGAIIGDEVKVTLDIQAIRQN
jgi:polyisoprenoid-binding protein YceI